MENNRINPAYYPLPLQGTVAQNKIKTPAGKEGSFAETLEKVRSQKLHFSAHARQRLEARRIDLQPEDLEKLEAAVEKAAAKGCRSSLLLYGKMAFIAGVPSRTIITAVDGRSMKEHVFTNIDSAVVVK
ncbi:MAG TPA: flagellar protein [Firmicutes bacterium]|jgi:flagellar operon protein|nr:flagellar protein [Bacillota bacterium]